MHAVARHAGVSPMSVSNVINGRRVLPKTREAVLKAIADLDYTPNAAARALASAAKASTPASERPSPLTISP